MREEEALLRFPTGSLGWLPIADCSRRRLELTAADRLTIRMAPGGGFVARLRPVP